MAFSVRDLWALFGNDLKAAQQSIVEARKKQPKNLHLMHLAISCGLHDTIQLIADTDNLSIVHRATLSYRLQLRRKDHHGAFKTIVHDERAKQTVASIENCLKLNLPLNVRLQGGLGDHIEAISMMQRWCTTKDLTIQLLVDENRIKQLKRITNQLNWISGLTTYRNQSNSTLFSVLRRIIWEDSATNPIQGLATYQNTSKSDVLCCWRAVGGTGEQFSIHSRSIPFHNVYGFYQVIFEQNPNATITDITQWKPWEKNKLRHLGIHLHDPTHGDAADLAALAASHRQIISIDTALAHLCAVSNIRANLLLTLFPDERWNYLLNQDSCYTNNLTIFQQDTFGDWSTTMERLSQSIHRNLSDQAKRLDLDCNKKPEIKRIRGCRPTPARSE